MSPKRSMMDVPDGSLFYIGNIDDIFKLDILDSDSDEEKLLNSLNFNQMDHQIDVNLPENEVSREAESRNGQGPQTEQEPQSEQEPQTEQESQTEQAPQMNVQKENQGRFHDVTMEEISHYHDSTQSKSTKVNAKWCMKSIQDWSIQMCGQLIDFETISSHALADILMRFYCSAKPQEKEEGKEEYHKNTIKNIRAGINRNLQNIGRNINIVSDTEFKTANRVFSGLLKERVKSGASLPTKHKEIINMDDMKAIRQYFLAASDNPVVLRHFVWFSIAFHFVTRGNETHFQLTPPPSPSHSKVTIKGNLSCLYMRPCKKITKVEQGTKQRTMVKSCMLLGAIMSSTDAATSVTEDRPTGTEAV